jgi:hypothetical protein
MLVDRDPEVRVRRFSLNYLQYGRTQSPLLSPSSAVIWAADDHHAQGDFQDRVRWHQANLPQYILQRRSLQGLRLVVEPA